MIARALGLLCLLHLASCAVTPSRELREPSPGISRELAHLRARYDDEVASTDREFGRFLDLLRFLDLYDSSLIVLLSDHGEELGDHGGFGHGRTLYEEVLHVPLIIKFPGSRWAGRTVDQPVSTLDMVPTLLEVLGVDLAPGEHDGRSLSGLLGPDREARPERWLYAETRTDLDSERPIVFEACHDNPIILAELLPKPHRCRPNGSPHR